MRLLLALVASRGLRLRHIDITAAYLHSNLDMPMYIEQPHGMEVPGDYVCRLKKAIYGLKTVPRRWAAKLRSVLEARGFKPLKWDANIYRKSDTIISTYVDDFMILAITDYQIDTVIKMLEQDLQIRDLGQMNCFLGINIEQSDGIRIHQADKIADVLNDLGLSDCRGASTPIADDSMVDRDEERLVDADTATKYRSAVGSLLHIAIMTRPDIQYAVNRLASRMRAPIENAMLALKHLARYMSRTKGATLYFPAGLKPQLTGSTDSSWGTIFSPKSIAGNSILVGGTPVCWASKKQPTTAQSTCEAEYKALQLLTRTTMVIKPLFEEIFGRSDGAMPTQIDNTAAILIAESRKISTRNRHFLMAESVVRDAIAAGLLRLQYTPSEEVIADGLTKALQRQKHADFCRMVRVSI